MAAHRLDQARRYSNLGLHEPLVDPHHGAAGSGANVDVVLVVAREVVDTAHGLLHPGVADQLRELGALVRAVEARGHQHGDAGGRHAAVQQRADQHGQVEAVGDGARDVADENARRGLPLRELAERRQRRPALRDLRLVDGRLHGRGRIVEQRHRGLLDHHDLDALVDLDLDVPLPVHELDLTRHRGAR